MLLAVVVLAACSAPKRVPETPQSTGEAGATSSVAVEQGVTNQPAATYTPYPTYTRYPTYTALPASTTTSTPKPTVASLPTGTPAPTSAPASAVTDVPTIEASRPSTQPVPVNTVPPAAALSSGLTRRADTDPGPPFTVLVGSIRAGESGYRVTGTVRNDGPETYEGIGVIGTFFGAGGLWYGPTDAHCPCLFLEPGGECPFSLDVLPGNYVEYLLHPEGRPVEYRQPAPLVLSGLNIRRDGTGNVRITGTAVNENPFSVNNAMIAGELLDASGKIVSLGSTIVVGEIMSGASAAFDLRIDYRPYSRYRLHVQAVRN
jgi:hypothetical protein